ncbi:hypothetical protein BJ508DRAFT_412040 [Ascobolus immersus RN42]|uniref:Uncharacterized protein n=1 Tax=Ascobolus immersus RN42 TaxID=1160509 RepID=A0A3N4IM32_ASCIM|nr:hypothetical protein BJ508DRAFT_412040 [Ascobolus immersus RN42]
MHPTLRRLAASHNFPAPFSPTGLTGVLTHPLPRTTLIALYTQTLSLLSSLPSTSVYRTSTEALTRKRLAAVESVKPYGWAEYEAKLASIKKRYGLEGAEKKGDVSLAIAAAQMREVIREIKEEVHPEEEAMIKNLEGQEKFWDRVLGDVSTEAAKAADKASKEQLFETLKEIPREPPLSRGQIHQIEEKIAGGLIEEIIHQGMEEIKVIEAMKEYKPWEDLEETAPEGQWVYFERK